MIRTAMLGDHEFTTSALGFGMAGLYRESSKTARKRLLDAALDAGIIHFDVAPIYGLGLAQGELGRALRGHRANVVIATKVGIGLTPFARVLGRVQSPARSLLKRSPRMQEQARKGAASPSSGRLGGLLYKDTFDPRAARRSLEQSLRELGTHIDLLLLHDPEPSEVHRDDVRELLDEAQKSGKIRFWGIAGDAAAVVSLGGSLRHQSSVLQVRDDIFRVGELRAPRAEYLVTYGVLGNALPTILSHVTASPGRVREWNVAVGDDCTSPRVVADLLLKDSLRVNALGTVLYSTTRPERLRDAVSLSNDDQLRPDPPLEAFRQLVGHQIKMGTTGTEDRP